MTATTTLGDLVGPVFDEVITFLDRVEGGEHPPLDRQRAALKGALDAAWEEARRSPSLLGGFEQVAPALIYWVDEVLTNSRWSHAEEWRNAILEFEYLGTRDAFDEFWRRAEPAEAAALRRERDCRAARRPYPGDDVLKTFFLCVALGFRGKLYLDEPGLRAWVRRVRPLVELPASEPPRAERSGWGLAPLRGDRMLVTGSWAVSAWLVLAILGFISAVHAGL